MKRSVMCMFSGATHLAPGRPEHRPARRARIVDGRGMPTNRRNMANLHGQRYGRDRREKSAAVVGRGFRPAGKAALALRRPMAGQLALRVETDDDARARYASESRPGSSAPFAPG